MISGSGGCAKESQFMKESQMPNPLTAERAREIAHATLIHLEGRTDREYEYAVGDERPFALALIDRDIETLEACAHVHCLFCHYQIPLDPDIGKDDYRHKKPDDVQLLRCDAQFEQHERIRLRAERERLSSPEPSPKPRDNS